MTTKRGRARHLGASICLCCGAPTFTRFSAQVLLAVADAPLPLSMHAIAKLLETEKRSVLRALGKMEELLAYGPNMGLAKTYTLSRLGREVVERMREEAAESAKGAA